MTDNKIEAFGGEKFEVNGKLLAYIRFQDGEYQGWVFDQGAWREGEIYADLALVRSAVWNWLDMKGVASNVTVTETIMPVPIKKDETVRSLYVIEKFWSHQGNSMWDSSDAGWTPIYYTLDPDDAEAIRAHCGKAYESVGRLPKDFRITKIALNDLAKIREVDANVAEEKVRQERLQEYMKKNGW